MITIILIFYILITIIAIQDEVIVTHQIIKIHRRKKLTIAKETCGKSRQIREKKNRTYNRTVQVAENTLKNAIESQKIHQAIANK